MDEWLALAGSRPDLEAARRMLAAGELEDGIRRAALLPRVGLVLRHDRFDDRPLGTNGGSSYVAAAWRWSRPGRSCRPPSRAARASSR